MNYYGTPLRVVLRFGQSNTVGKGTVSELAEQGYSTGQIRGTYVYFKSAWDANDNGSYGWLDMQTNQNQLNAGLTNWGAEFSLCGDLQTRYKTPNILIKLGEDGTPFFDAGRSWNAATSGANALLDEFLDWLVTPALDKLDADGVNYVIDGIYINQGESDSAIEARADAYEANANAIIAKIRGHRAILNSARVVFTRTFQRTPPIEFGAPVRTYQETQNYINSDDFVAPDDIHYDPASYVLEGERLAAL